MWPLLSTSASRLAVATCVLTAIAAAPAAAQLPDPVRAMIDAAAQTGEKAKLDAVVEAAKATNPDATEEIDALRKTGREVQKEIAEAKRRGEREEIRAAGFFQRWEGEGQIGGFQSTGNTQNVGVTAALRLKRTGIDWSHLLRATADYQRSNKVTSREQYFASYEPRYQINPRLFTYGLAQYEHDRFQGYWARYAVSGGLGYRVIDGEDLTLSVKAGPAWRRTNFNTGMSESSVAALAALDFDWQISDSIKFTQDSDFVADGSGSATAIIGSNNTSINLVTGLEADIISSLTTRVSYTVEYDSNPPVGAVSTDTRTRFTLIYGF